MCVLPAHVCVYVCVCVLAHFALELSAGDITAHRNIGGDSRAPGKHQSIDGNGELSGVDPVEMDGKQHTADHLDHSWLSSHQPLHIAKMKILCINTSYKSTQLQISYMAYIVHYRGCRVHLDFRPGKHQFLDLDEESRSRDNYLKVDRSCLFNFHPVSVISEPHSAAHNLTVKEQRERGERGERGGEGGGWRNGKVA